MNKNARLIAIALLALAGTGCGTGQQTTDQEEANKKIVVDFYDKAINQKDFAAASEYLGDQYIQHNPLAADGPEGLKAFLEFAKANLQDYHTEFKRVFADGDYVIVHAHAKRDSEDRGSAVMDIFRLENGKVVEHWDVVQAIPEKSANDNGMF
jgi:predicted SnoaL-like aldol condensation-catalyzing enzyme